MKRWKQSALLGFLGALIGLVAGLPRQMLEIDEAIGLRALFSVREPAGQASDVVVVGISRTTSEALGLPVQLDEWPRAVHAELVDRLVSAGADVVAFDIIFSKLGEPDDAAVFANALERAGNVLLLERTAADEVELGSPAAAGAIVLQRQELPHASFKAAALGTAPFVLPTVPVRVSQFWIFDRGGANLPTLPALALQAHALPVLSHMLRGIETNAPELLGRASKRFLMTGRTHELERIAQELRDGFESRPRLAVELRAVKLPGEAAVAAGGDGANRQLEALNYLYAGPSTGYLNYYGPAGSIPTIPYQAVMLEARDALEKFDIRGKTVFVGLSESRQSEQIDTFYSVFSERTGRNLSGVEIGATAYANLINQSFVVPLPIAIHAALLGLWGALLGVIMMAVGSRLGILVVIASAVAYAGFAAAMFATSNLWLPVFVPVLIQVPVILLLGTFWKQIVERRTKEHLRAALTAYVPSPVVTQVDSGVISRESLRQNLHGTCLLTDVMQYTRISESLKPPDLAALMNEYYGVLYSVVTTHGGMVSDTAGDSMLAIWAGEQADARHCRQACEAALAMRAAIERMNEAKSQNRLSTGFGLATGEIMLANIGSDEQYSFRAVGDIVTTASRIQTLNRTLGTTILASADSIEPQSSLMWRDVGNFVLAGKTQAVGILQLLDPDNGDDAQIIADRDTFALGLEAFRRGIWSQALRHFEALTLRMPRDGAARYYLTLCEKYARAEPDPDWDGTIRMSQK